MMEKTMQQVFLKAGKAWVESVPVPQIGHNEVLVKVEVSPICGGDKRLFFGKELASGGHEGTGIVVDPGDSQLLKTGDRVLLNPMRGCGHCDYCRTGRYMYCTNKPAQFPPHFAQYVPIPDFQCNKIPDDINLVDASLAGCALAPAYQALSRMNINALDTLVVTGLGPVGLGAVAIAKFFGARVIATDSFPYRKDFARRLGADVIDSSDPECNKKIIDLAGGPLLKLLDASGAGAAERQCIELAAPDATVAFVGRNTGTISISPTCDIQMKGLTIIGVWHVYLNQICEIFEIIRRSELVRSIATHTYGFTNVQRAFEVFAGGETGKVLLKPWE